MDHLSVLVPASIELALELVGPLLRYVMGSVGRSGAVVQIEGLIWGIDVGVLDELDGLVGEIGAQVIAVLGLGGLIDIVVVVDQLGIPLIGVSPEEPVVTLEAPSQRPTVVGTGGCFVFRRGEVPLADEEGVVAVGQEHLAQHPGGRRDDRVVSGEPTRSLRDGGHPDRVVVAPGHDAGPRWGAQCCRVHVRIPKPGLGQAIEYRGVHQSTEAGELAVANIIENDDHHVRRTLKSSGRSGPGRSRLFSGAPDGAWERGPVGVGHGISHQCSLSGQILGFGGGSHGESRTGWVNWLSR